MLNLKLLASEEKTKDKSIVAGVGVFWGEKGQVWTIYKSCDDGFACCVGSGTSFLQSVVAIKVASDEAVVLRRVEERTELFFVCVSVRAVG